MSQFLVNPSIVTNIPGAYPIITVQSQPVGLGQSGIIVIMGEATGGPSYTQIALKNNVFTPDQLSKVQQQYISGPIVDAFSALTDPSNDTNITGSANQIYIVKTNTGTQASIGTLGSGGTTTAAVVSAQAYITVVSTVGLAVGQQIVDVTTPSNLAPGTTITSIVGTSVYLSTPATGSGGTDIVTASSTYGIFLNQNYGTPGNSFSYRITALQTEVPPTVVSGPITFGGSINAGLTFSVRLNGAAAVVATLPAATYTSGTQIACLLYTSPSP